MPSESQLDLDTILKLTSLIYDAVADSSGWQAFLEAFVCAVNAERGTFTIRDVDRDEFTAVSWHGWPPEILTLYSERYAAIDPWRIGAAQLPEGAVGTDEDICPRHIMESSAAYRELYEPNNAIHGMGGTVLASTVGQSVIAIVRGADRGPFRKRELGLLRVLMPHLKRAALLYGQFGAMRRQLAMFTDHLDRYSHAYFIADAEGRILYANASAQEIVNARDGITLEHGRMAIASPGQGSAFRKAVTEIAAGNGSLRRVAIHRPSHRDPYRLILMPIRDSGEIPLGVSVPAVSILAIDASLRPEPDVPLLCELFSLTPAEARVAGKLALGRNLEEIATELGISLETVRTHAKRALSKTGTDRQGELISLMLRSVPLRRL
jgi:DNA-binding CsgD family transcriptional regulator/PAS domain-containing protein